MRIFKWIGILFVVMAAVTLLVAPTYRESTTFRSVFTNWETDLPVVEEMAKKAVGPPVELAKDAGLDPVLKFAGDVAGGAGDALAKRYIEGRGGTVGGLAAGQQVAQTPPAPAPARPPAYQPTVVAQQVPSVYQPAPTQPTPAVVAAEPRYEVSAEAQAWYETALASYQQAEAAYRALQRGSVLEANDLATMVQKGTYAFDFAIAVARAAYPLLGFERAIEDALAALDDSVATKAEAKTILDAYNAFLSRVDSATRRAEAREFRANYEVGAYLAPEEATGMGIDEMRVFLMNSNNEARRAQSTGFVSPQDDLIELLAGRCVIVAGKAVGPTMAKIVHPHDLIPTSAGSLGQVLFHRRTFESVWGGAIQIGGEYCLPPKPKAKVVVDMVGIPQVVTSSPGAPSLDLSRFPAPEEPQPILIQPAVPVTQPFAPTPVAAVPEASGVTYEEWVQQQVAAKAAGQVAPVPPLAPTPAPPTAITAATPAVQQGCWSRYMNRWVLPGEEESTWAQKCVFGADGEYKWVSNK